MKTFNHDWNTYKPSYGKVSDDLCQTIKDKGYISLVVTSPPYKDCDGYTPELINEVFHFCRGRLNPNSLLFVNFGHLQEDMTRPYDMVKIIEQYFELRETFIWVKNHYTPLGGHKRVNNLFEFVFMFSNGDNYKLDRLSIGVPYKDKTNVKRYAGGRDLKCGGNVWYIDYETIQKQTQKLHKDRFPVELPRRCIKLSGINKGSLVFDPFCGSGTTGVAAQELGMDFIGVDKNPIHLQVVEDRLKLGSLFFK